MSDDELPRLTRFMVTIEVRRDEKPITLTFEMDPEHVDMDVSTTSNTGWPSLFARAFPIEKILHSHGHLMLRGLIKERVDDTKVLVMTPEDRRWLMHALGAATGLREKNLGAPVPPTDEHHILRKLAERIAGSDGW